MMIENPFEDKETMLWERDTMKYYSQDWLNGRKVIHGHSPTAQTIISESIDSNQDVVCIDNGSFLKRPEFGSVCILELGSNKIDFVK
jgi:serine/threonine protein phosphatase 1